MNCGVCSTQSNRFYLLSYQRPLHETLNQTNKIMKTSLRILLIAGLLFSVGACTVYKQVDQPGDVIFNDNSEVRDYLSGYDIYMHNSQGVFQMNNVWTAGDTMWGYVVRIDSSRLAAKSRDQKNDMNITVSDDKTFVDSTLVGIPKSEIKTVGLMGRDGRATFLKSMSAVASLVLIIIAIILAIGLIGVSVWASAASSDGSNASSDQSSDSNSNSGDSGSGASSDGSGCYIATMVYGSYEADEVWVLRRFRDNVLQHSRFGRWFINWYYSWSPGFVKKYSKYNFVHRAAKFALQPIVWLLK